VDMVTLALAKKFATIPVINLVPNGGFENLLNGWIAYGTSAEGDLRTATSEISKFGTYSLQLIRSLNRTDGYGLAQIKYPFMQGHVYYFGGYCYIPSSVTVTAIPTISVGGQSRVRFNIDVVDTWQRQSGIHFHLTETGADFIVGTGAKAQTECTVYYDGIFLVDLTEAFGAGNEPTREEMDLLLDVLGGWWDGKVFLTQTQLTRWHLAMRQLFLQKANLELRPMVTFCFDDGKASDYEKAFPYLQRKGIRATYFQCTSRIGQAGYCTSAQLAEMAAAGHEIGSHTVTHANLATLTEEQMIAELKNSKLAIQTITGYPCRTLGIPDGQYNDYALQMLAGFYEAARCSNQGLNYYGDASRTFNYKAYFMDSPGRTLADMKSLVDSAVSEKAWLVISMHEIVESNPTSWQTLESDFRELVDYVFARKPHELDTVTFYEGACRIRTPLSLRYYQG
jgi:peptidoglycan/xylan/chitin deacetylase (PgdA/CDA1 family)